MTADVATKTHGANMNFLEPTKEFHQLREIYMKWGWFDVGYFEGVFSSFLELLSVDQVRCFGTLLGNSDVFLRVTPPRKGTILNGNNMAKKQVLENW